MKVLLVNGSNHSNGTTMQALKEIAKTLEKDGIESEIIQIGSSPIADCLGCGSCKRSGECVFKDDGVNSFVRKAFKADGFIFASPVYYAHPTGRLLSFLDRAFISGRNAFRFKPGAAVAVARRAGTSSTFDSINKFFGISSMPVVPSTYWNNVFGADETDAPKDEEGMQTMRNLAHNMAWMLKCIEIGKKNGVNHPEEERNYHTNFIKK